MAETAQQSRTDKINKWVQTTAIIIAALWGIYTFLYTQVLVPKSAPVNITVDLDLKKAGESHRSAVGANQPLVPVEMRISAKNPSSRPVYLLPTFWIAYGVKISPTGEQDPFREGLVVTGETGTGTIQRHTAETANVVVAYGRLLQDTVLKPGETAARKMIFYVPQNEYDLVRVYAAIPTVDKQGTVDIQDQLDEKTGVQSTVYRLGPKGERIKVSPGKDGNYPDLKMELQQATSQAELSLW